MWPRAHTLHECHLRSTLVMFASASELGFSPASTINFFRRSKAWNESRCFRTNQRQKVDLRSRRSLFDMRFLPRAAVNFEDASDDGSDGSRQVSSEVFCIIEGPETVMDFARLQLQEIQDNIKSRRNAIFLLLEEVRRLRIQQRIKSLEENFAEDENEMPEFSSFIPFLPPLTSKTLRQYYATCLLLMTGIVLFGGLIAPMLEVNLGPGGTSYRDFIRSAHLPLQLSEVDPIVASFSGGAVGVISSLIVVEMNNVKRQEQKTCKYCHGTGYLACARCSATGISASNMITMNHGTGQQHPSATSQRCPNCSGTAKVMCPTCLCTGMVMANENNPRIDPFD